jgi:hypothetical protein
MLALKTEFLCDVIVELDLEGMVNIGATPSGVRMIVYVKGGKVEGPKLKGVILPGGGDWFTIRPDGVMQLDVRVAMRTDDGDTIYVYYRGINTMTPEIRGRIMGGETVDPSEYYFRTTPVFETASEKYGWLNRIVAVGVGQLTATDLRYSIHAVL